MPKDTSLDSLPSPEAIRTAALEVIRDPEYRLAVSEIDATLSEKIRSVFARIWEPFEAVLSALHDRSPVLYYLLAVFLIFLLALLIWHMLSAFRRSLDVSFSGGGLPAPQGPASVSELETAAGLAAESGDYIAAVRRLFMAALFRLAETEKTAVLRAATNREYLSRYAGRTFMPSLKYLVDLIDFKYYGCEKCTSADYDSARIEYGKIKKRIGKGANAHRA